MARYANRRVLIVLTIGVFLLGGVGGLLASELRDTRVQARLWALLAGDAGFALGEGPSEALRFPTEGPHDRRLGYVELPRFVERLVDAGGLVEAQARWTEHMVRLVDWGLFAPYAEKSVGGLEVFDRAGRPLFDAAGGAHYRDFEEVPPFVALALTWIENRELLDEQQAHKNPAVEVDRFAYAVVQAGISRVKPGHKVPGASTLATQLEKLRHSRGGRTRSGRQKLRQMASAAVRAYLEGPDTLAARRRVLVGYLNSVPLAAVRGEGEVIGFGPGLRAWFGADFDEVNALLAPGTPAGPAQGEAARQALALLCALRRPQHFLRDDRAALERLTAHYARSMARSGLITEALRQAIEAAPLRFRTRRRDPALIVDGKATTATRVELLAALKVERLYDLDRLDLKVHTSLDLEAQASVGQLLDALRKGAEPELDSGAGSPGEVDYSFVLYERVGDENLLRVSTDTGTGPFDLNRGMKLELGSTAKLRTLTTWLELIAEAHGRYAGLDALALEALPIDPSDALSAWVVESLRQNPGLGLDALLEAALERPFSASAKERFATGGGLQRFSNYHRRQGRRRPSVRQAFQQSVNLPFVRMMREVVEHLTFADGEASALLADPAHPGRRRLLEAFVDEESRVFLRRFYRRYAPLGADGTLAVLAARAKPRGMAALFLSARPEASPEELGDFLRGWSDQSVEDLPRLRAKTARLSLADRAFLAGLHPLELWLAGWLREIPGGEAEAMQASTEARFEAYSWLLERPKPAIQNQRIRVVLEQEAFAEITRRWRRLGFPFRLVPSLGTALGASGDRPAALAELMGIISAGGTRLPTRRISRLHFAAETPYETVVRPGVGEGRQVMDPAVARALRLALGDVVEAGTAKALRGAFGGGALVVGGKTGTGDNRARRFDRDGDLISEEVRSRTAALSFFVGDRWFGVITAHVNGPVAAGHDFTSALPVRILRRLAPRLLGAFAPAEIL